MSYRKDRSILKKDSIIIDKNEMPGISDVKGQITGSGIKQLYFNERVLYKTEKSSKDASALGAVNRIGVNLLASSDIDSDTAILITDRLAFELSEKIGENRVVYFRKEDRKKSVNRMLLGSIGKMGRKYFISVKIINVENRKILYSAKKNILSTD